MSDFEEFAKIARLSRNCVITEKIDGTNAQVHIVPAVDVPLLALDQSYVIAKNADGDVMLAGSRSRYVTPAADNYGFAAWVKAHAEELWALGPGRHYGEWWGSGCQRGYGLQNGEKRFSLFNSARWIRSEAERIPQPELHDNRQRVMPPCCHVVPVLYRGPFSTEEVDVVLASLRLTGSMASPGFMRPEGVVIYHEAARTYFKKTLEKDEEPKGKRS